MATVVASTDQSRRRLEAIVVLCLSVTATAAYAVHAGQDINWDQRNYHVYSVYAWLHGNPLTAFAPAQIQSWLNPLPHLPQYLLIRHVPPVIAGAVMGSLAGINGLLLWTLVRRLQGHHSRPSALAAAGLTVILGLSGSLFLSFLGTSFAEYLCSPLVLGTVILLTRRNNVEGGPRAFALAGLCLGAACGVKLTNLIFALGMSVTLAILWPAFKFRLAWTGWFALGGVAGFLLVGGYWAARLWLAFGNPVFPFFNALFGSPWFPAVNFADGRFLPRSFVQAIVTYPFAWLAGLHPTSELPFREPRFAYVAVLLPMAFVATWLRSRAAVADARVTAVCGWNFWLCVLFFLSSFAIWLKQFGIQRYALPLELLTGVLVLLSLERICRSARTTLAVLTLATLFALVWTRPPDWGRTPYAASWFGLEAAPLPSPSVLHIMVGGTPMAYALAFLPDDFTVVRLGGNLRLEPESPLGKRTLEIIQAHRGPMVTMSSGPMRERDRAQLERFGLSQTGACATTIRSRIDQFLTCDVVLAKSTADAR